MDVYLQKIFKSLIMRLDYSAVQNRHCTFWESTLR